MGQGDVTVHGFRSTFRDWAAERTSFPSDVVEMALAHAVRQGRSRLSAGRPIREAAQAGRGMGCVLRVAQGWQGRGVGQSRSF